MSSNASGPQPSEGLSIDRAGAADRGEVVSLLRAQLDEHDIALDEARLGAAVDGVFADASRGLVLLARRGGGAIGFAYVSFNWSLEHGGRSAWLDELYVAPAERERGVGRRLLLAACDAAEAAGCAAVDLEVEASHARAEHLYAREGFSPHTRRRWVRRFTKA